MTPMPGAPRKRRRPRRAAAFKESFDVFRADAVRRKSAVKRYEMALSDYAG